MICSTCTKHFARPSLLQPSSRTAFQAASPRRTLTIFSRTLRLPRLPVQPTSTCTSAASPLVPSRLTFALSQITSPSPSLLTAATTTRAFSTSAPALAPRDTYDMTHRVRKRRHGFLSRIKTRKGRMLLSRRRAKGRQSLSH